MEAATAARRGSPGTSTRPAAPRLTCMTSRGAACARKLSLEPHEYMLTVLAFVLDVERRQWSTHFTAPLTGLTPRLR